MVMKTGKGEWQGYQDQDFEAVIDLKEVQDISLTASTRFSLLDFDASICSVYTSVDNINYKIVDSPILHSVDPKEDTTRILPFTQ
jgi:hypothetical protein